MATLRAEVPAQSGSRYLQQLCKHWSHRFEVAFDATQGTVQLNGALCRFAAEPERLVLTLEGGEIELPDLEPPDLERLAGVVTEHLKRFAFREELAVHWMAAQG